MKKSAFFSALFHILFLVILLVGIPLPQRTVPVNEQPIILEFEKIADKSAAPKLQPDASKEEKKTIKKVEKKIEPQEEKKEEKPEEKIEEKKEEVIEEKKSAPKEEMKEKETDPVLDKKKEEKPKKDPPKEEKKESKPKKDAPKDKKKETKPTKAEVNLDPKKTKPKPLSSEKKKSLDDIVNSLIDDTLEEEGKEKGAPASAVGMEITATDIDAIRQKIYKCWIIPIGVQGAKDLVVDVRMDIAQDGNVTKAEVVNSRSGDPAFQAAAESAQRAVLDPACNPLPLPPEKYEKWKRLTLRFNPKDMY